MQDKEETKVDSEESEVSVPAHASDAEGAEGALKKKGGKKENGKLHDMPTPPSEGDIVEGPVIDIEKSKLFVSLHPFGTGIIFGREFMNARDIIRKIAIGDVIAAKVIDPENEEGYVELSLKEARKALVWKEAEEAIAEKRTFELPIKEANKGGLILEWQGIQGFVPASQLSSDHYPRVEDGDKDRILEELKKLIGTRIAVSIISISPKENKLIFSEKESSTPAKEEMISHYKIGDVVTGEITGIVDFGVFLKVEEGLEGLVHISELDWGLVEDPRTLFKIGQKVEAKIIEIKEEKISLSIKSLKDNPWKEAEGKYSKDMIVSGVIIKFNKHGALASIEEGVAGLVHVSEFGSEDKLREKLELGRNYNFKIALFDPKDQKMTLSPVFEEESK